MKAVYSFTLVVFVLVLFGISRMVMVSPMAANGTGPVGRTVNRLTGSLTPPVSKPQGGGPPIAGPGHVVLNAFDFKPYFPNTAYEYSSGYGADMLINLSGDSASFIAPVHLPQGATINQVVAYYMDNDSGDLQNIEVDLFVLDDFDTIMPFMAFLTPNGATEGITYAATSAISDPLVDNTSHSYAAQVELPSSHSVGFMAMRIDYSYALSVPLVRR